MRLRVGPRRHRRPRGRRHVRPAPPLLRAPRPRGLPGDRPRLLLPLHGVDPTDFGAIIGSITPENLKGDFAAAADALRAGGASTIGVTGFCMGGWFTYRAAMWADDLGVDGGGAVLRRRHRRELGEPALPDAPVLRRPRRVHPDGRHRDGAGAPRRRRRRLPGRRPRLHARRLARTTTKRRPPTRGQRMLAFFGEHLHLTTSDAQVKPRATIARMSASAPSRSRLDVTIGIPWLSGSSPSR